MAPRLILCASGKTLTSRPGATEQWIADGALMEQQITPRAPQIIPEYHKTVWITVEHHSSPRNLANLSAARKYC